jgi:uncharacterized Zn finger protein
MPLCLREAEQPALIVGQDGILRAGWQPASAGLFTRKGRRVANPPQVANLPHNFCRIPVS